MYRRRRARPREVAFSFDSFLDVVANVVGIILRLILVAWVGAKSYKAFQPPPPPTPPVLEEVVALPDPDDPLAAALDRPRRELPATQPQLLEQLTRYEQAQHEKDAAQAEAMVLKTKRQEVVQHKAELAKLAQDSGEGGKAAALSLQQIQERSQRLTEEIEALRKAPPVKQTL